MGALPTPEPFDFPPDDQVELADPPAPISVRPILLTRLEQPTAFASRTVPGARILPLRPYVVSREPYLRPQPAALPSPSISPSFRNLLIAAAIAIALAICLAFVLGSAAPRPADPPLAPSPSTTTTARTSIPAVSQTAAIHPAKPSAYGEAFLPPPAAPRTHRSARSATSGSAATATPTR